MYIPMAQILADRRDVERVSGEPDRIQFPHRPTVLILEMRYDPADGQFFREEALVDLQGRGLLGPIFSARIQGINNELRKYRSLCDFGPTIRAAFLVIFLAGSIVALANIGKMNPLSLWGVLVGGLMVLSIALFWTYRDPAFVKFVEEEMKRFSALDAPLGVTWESVRTVQEGMYSFQCKRDEARVPWKIVIKESRGTRPEGDQFLPAYTSVSLDMEFIRPHDDPALPKYVD
ncbi:hypothetical protein HDU98_007607 [Podochytrium sp. JEL0797]|nr:hypothetical protein HDU98_007607 [Podochytrium sp. JEL0797]